VKAPARSTHGSLRSPFVIEVSLRATSLHSGVSLRSSLASLVAVLAPPAVVERAAPFIPTRTN